MQPVRRADFCNYAWATNCAHFDLDKCLASIYFTQPFCDPEFEALRACFDQDPGFECVDDEPVPFNCTTEFDAANTCYLDHAMIIGVCEQLLAASCANGVNDVGLCAETQHLYHDSCPAEHAAFLDCFSGWSCDMNGDPVPDGCVAENDALQTCM